MALQQSLLSLPAEIRSKIWAYCIDDIEEDIAMCCCDAQPLCKHTFSSLTALYHNSQRSCRSDSQEPAPYLINLNLIFVSKQTFVEAQHFYSEKVLKFCSRPCLADLLKTLGEGRQAWIKRIEIAIDLRPLRVGFSYSSSRYIEMLQDEKQLLRDLANDHFSSCQFEGVEVWVSSSPFFRDILDCSTPPLLRRPVVQVGHAAVLEATAREYSCA